MVWIDGHLGAYSGYLLHGQRETCRGSNDAASWAPGFPLLLVRTRSIFPRHPVPCNTPATVYIRIRGILLLTG